MKHVHVIHVTCVCCVCGVLCAMKHVYPLYMLMCVVCHDVCVVLCAQSYRDEEREEAQHQHQVERRQMRRSAGDITKTFKDKPKFWMGQRVNTK